MGNLFFPVLRGLTWKGKKQIGFATLPIDSQGGRDEQFAQWIYPVWRWDLDYSFVKQGRIGEDLAPGLNQLLAFFNAMGGGFEDFIYRDPYDNQVTNQYLFTGDGHTNTVQLFRTVTGTNAVFNEPVYYVPAAGSAPPIQPSSGDAFLTVSDNGGTPTFQGNTDGLMTLNFTPAPGHIITWSGNFYFRVHFAQEMLKCEEFMFLYHSAQIALESATDATEADY